MYAEPKGVETSIWRRSGKIKKLGSHFERATSSATLGLIFIWFCAYCISGVVAQGAWICLNGASTGAGLFLNWSAL